VCDVAEACDGTNKACPADAFQSGNVCRSATGVCDVAETCSGLAAGCPADSVAGAFVTCRSSTGTCDLAENCNGTLKTCPPDAFQPSSVTCRSSVDVCDVAEHCSGSSAACPANQFASSSTTCRPSAGGCDVAENCSGSSASCPADTKLSSGTVCRSSAGACDVVETCDGASAACPIDAVQPSGTVCRSSSGACDPAEGCDGSAGSCPVDVPAQDTDNDGTCDLLDDCPTIADPGQADSDNDGRGDVCDPCNNIRNVIGLKPKITIVKLLTPPGDDKLKFKGSITIPPQGGDPTLDPASNGARAIITDSTGIVVTDVTIPAGAYNAANRAGWKVNGTGTAFTYVNSGLIIPLPQGIKKFGLKRSTKVAGLLKFSITGKNGSYAVVTSNLPLIGTVIVDPPYATTGLCGESFWAAPQNPLGVCAVASGGNLVRCK
jgi:hypothetical protein